MRSLGGLQLCMGSGSRRVDQMGWLVGGSGSTLMKSISLFWLVTQICFLDVVIDSSMQCGQLTTRYPDNLPGSARLPARRRGAIEGRCPIWVRGHPPLSSAASASSGHSIGSQPGFPFAELARTQMHITTSAQFPPLRATKLSGEKLPICMHISWVSRESHVLQLARGTINR